MFDMILNILTGMLVFFLVAGIIGGVIVFCLAATWMQVNDGKEALHEEKASAQEGISAHPAAKCRRRTAAACYPCQMP